MASPEGQFNMNAVRDKITILHENLNPFFKEKKRLFSEEKALIENFLKLSQVYKKKQEAGILNKSELEILKNELTKLAEKSKIIKEQLKIIDGKIKNHFNKKTQQEGAEKQKDLEK